MFKIPATFEQKNIITSAYTNTNHGQKYASILRFSKRYLALRPNGQRIGVCTYIIIYLLISQQESFLNKIVQKL